MEVFSSIGWLLTMFRFRLRSILILIGIIAVALGWFARQRRVYHMEQQAIALIQAADDFDPFEKMESKQAPITEISDEQWERLRENGDVVLVEQQGEIVEVVEIVEEILEDEILTGDNYLEFMPGSTIVLDGPQKLMCGTGISGTIRRSWRGGDWSQKALAPMDSKFLYRVERVGLTGKQYDDRIVEGLVKFRMVESLELRHTGLTKEGFSQLLDGSNVRLKSIVLQGNVIDDDIISKLARFKSLRSLCLDGTTVTPQAIQQLKRKLPRCKIIQPVR